jgi:hypothetical protein
MIRSDDFQRGYLDAVKAVGFYGQKAARQCLIDDAEARRNMPLVVEWAAARAAIESTLAPDAGPGVVYGKGAKDPSDALDVIRVLCGVEAGSGEVIAYWTHPVAAVLEDKKRDLESRTELQGVRFEIVSYRRVP